MLPKEVDIMSRKEEILKRIEQINQMINEFTLRATYMGNGEQCENQISYLEEQKERLKKELEEIEMKEKNKKDNDLDEI